MTPLFLCEECSGELQDSDGNLKCESCEKSFGVVNDGVPVFENAVNHEDFFDKMVVERLVALYEGYDQEAFKDALKRTALWEMDAVNKKVGIARKFWWETHIGKVENKSVLEVGCGVNYFLPYWLESNNDVVAFDTCRENVVLSRRILKMIGIPETRIDFAVADAQTTRFNRTFDIININNVLHHIDDKREVFARMRECLADDGKLLLVEPNYYYPPRWVIETDALDPINFIKNYFVRNELIEKGEKAIIFSKFKSDLEAAGFHIEANDKDINYLGYFSIYWMGTDNPLAWLFSTLDRYLLSPLLPRVLAPFEYIVARKA